MSLSATPAGGPSRMPAVAGSFYPADPVRLRTLVDTLFGAAAGPRDGRTPVGLLVPHAGLVYSGAVAAAAWGCLRPGAARAEPARAEPARADGAIPTTVVILGTNHSAAWLDGVGAWATGAWEGPAGPVEVDAALARSVVGLGRPFVEDSAAHLGEHSIEVQLPLLRAVAPSARIVPLAVACGTAEAAVAAGERLGRLLAARRDAGARIVLAISTDMAHYPTAADADVVTGRLLPAIEALDAVALAGLEASLRGSRIPGLACGMCGIEPAVLGLAALRAMGARSGTALAAATSADAGGPPGRAVGYLAVRFDA